MSDHQTIQALSFDQYLAASGVSNSMLKVIREKSPFHLRYEMQNPPTPTPAQRFGTLTHTCLLQPDTALFHVRPEGLDGRTKDGKAWLADHQDREVITHEEAKAVEAMKAAVWEHPTASKLLRNADYERSLFVTDDKGTLRKLRPDILPNDGDYLPDVKTCESAHPEDFVKSMLNFGYVQQAAYYLDGTKLAGREYKVFAFIAVEKHPPYAVAVHLIEPAAVKYGRAIYERDLDIWRQCLATNVWPSYPTAPKCIEFPNWMQKTLEQYA